MSNQETKLCKHCKTEIPAAAKVCPNCRKKQGGIFKWIIIAVIAFIVIGVAAGGGDDDKETSKQASNTNTAENTVVANDVSTTAQAETVVEETETETKDKYYVGDTWENKYVLVSYDECGEYVSDNQFIQPKDGNKYIYAKFTFENIGKSDTTVGSWDFDCYADGFACDATYVGEDSGFSQTLSVGRKINGSVYFEVPKDATEIELEYSPNFLTSEKIVFVYSE